MNRTIIFVHGMFQNTRSWQNWISFFKERDFNCIAIPWPLHEGEPEDLRTYPPADLGDLRLETVVRKVEAFITGMPEKPIVIGHSVGGLIVQLLAAESMISAGVAISPVAPNAMLTFDWDFFKNSISITNPFKGDEPFYMTPEAFHTSFCNTLGKEAASIAYNETATHDSRNVLRDCLLGPGHVDLDMVNVPLLFIGGDKDHIIPVELVEKNAAAYKDKTSVAQFKSFPGRSHFICVEPGWREVAEYVEQWINSMNGTIK